MGSCDRVIIIICACNDFLTVFINDVVITSGDRTYFPPSIRQNTMTALLPHTESSYSFSSSTSSESGFSTTSFDLPSNIDSHTIICLTRLATSCQCRKKCFSHETTNQWAELLQQNMDTSCSCRKEHASYLISPGLVNTGRLRIPVVIYC